jgi:hypothetical protein
MKEIVLGVIVGMLTTAMILGLGAIIASFIRLLEDLYPSSWG